MDNNFTISEAAFEFTIEKMQQTIRRQFVVIIVLIIMFITMTGGVIYAFIRYENSFDTEYYHLQADKGDALYNYIGEDGVISNGTSDS